MSNNLENLKCLVFRGIENNYKIIKFKNRVVAKQYYKVANKKPNFKFVGLLQDCIDWCNKNKLNFEIIEREFYNLYE